MSLHLDFEPHAWYMGFAIKHDGGEVIGADEPLANENTQNCAEECKYTNDGYIWEAYTADGMTGYIVQLHGQTLKHLKERIKQWHLDRGTGYGERAAARRLKYLRGELRAERISYGELFELESLAKYIPDGDVELLEAAGVPESTR